MEAEKYMVILRNSWYRRSSQVENFLYLRNALTALLFNFFYLISSTHLYRLLRTLTLFDLGLLAPWILAMGKHSDPFELGLYQSLQPYPTGL